jgi:DNA-binding NarL/FixJ family response regulator
LRIELLTSVRAVPASRYSTFGVWPRSIPPGIPALTARHWEILRLVAEGLTNRQISRRLGVSEGTVRKHLENIYARLQVSSRAAAVTRAFQGAAVAAAT